MLNDLSLAVKAALMRFHTKNDLPEKQLSEKRKYRIYGPMGPSHSKYGSMKHHSGAQEIERRKRQFK